MENPPNPAEQSPLPTTEQFVPKHAHHLKTVEHPGILFALSLAPEIPETAADSKSMDLFYTAGMDGAVYRRILNAEHHDAEHHDAEHHDAEQSVNPEQSELVRCWKNHDNYVTCMQRVGETVVTGGFDRQLIWTDARNGEETRRVAAHAGWVRELVLFPDGQRLASCGDDMLVRLWDAATGKLLLTLDEHAKLTPQGFATALYALAISPDGRWLASGDRVGEIRVWDLEQGQAVTRLSAPDFYTYDPVKRTRSIGGIRSLCFSPDSKQLAVAGIGAVTNVDGFVGPCRVEVWDWQSKQRTFTGQSDHKAVLNQVRYHPSEPFLVAVGGGDGGGVLAVWDLKQEKPVHKAGVKGHLQRFCWRKQGLELSAAGYHGIQDWAFTTPPAEPEKKKPA